MSGTFSVLNRGTISRNLTDYILWGTSLSVSAAGIGFVMYLFSSDVEYSNAYRIRKAISNDEIALANHLYDTLRHDISTEDLALLSSKLQTAEVAESLEAAINKWDHLRAMNIFNQTKAEGTLPDGQIEFFEHRITEISEEQLYKKIVKTELELCRTYLETHANGEYLKEVLEICLIAEIMSLASSFESGKQLHVIHRDMLNLNQLLEKYSNEGIVISADIHERLQNDYVDPQSLDPERTIETLFLEKGMEVQVASTDEHWNEGYLRERDASFPIGTIGTVTNIGSYIAVEFDPEMKTHWRSRWHLGKYWKGDNKNVAEYRISELEAFNPLIDLKRFSHTWSTTLSLLEQYK